MTSWPIECFQTIQIIYIKDWFNDLSGLSTSVSLPKYEQLWNDIKKKKTE